MQSFRTRIFSGDCMDEALTLEADIPRWRFDDMRSGVLARMGRIAISREASVAFAQLYDPEPFHLDNCAAAANPLFGRLSASGWYTAVMMKMLLSEFVRSSGLRGLAGGGVKDMVWPKPVFPPTVLTVHLEVLAVRPSASRPSRGVMTMRMTALDESGDCVATMEITGIFARDS